MWIFTSIGPTMQQQPLKTMTANQRFTCQLRSVRNLTCSDQIPRELPGAIGGELHFQITVGLEGFYFKPNELTDGKHERILP